jgi:hypothetical protein
MFTDNRTSIGGASSASIKPFDAWQATALQFSFQLKALAIVS